MTHGTSGSDYLKRGRSTTDYNDFGDAETLDNTRLYIIGQSFPQVDQEIHTRTHVHTHVHNIHQQAP